MAANEMRLYVRSKVSIVVCLLNDERLNLSVEKNASIGDIFNEVCEYLGLVDTEIFGLAVSFGMS